MTMRFRAAGGAIPVIWDSIVIQGLERVAFLHPGDVYLVSEPFHSREVSS